MMIQFLFLTSWFFPTSLAENYTWEDCVKLAAKNNPALRAAQENDSASGDSVLSVRGGFFPQASGSLGYSYANSALSSSGATAYSAGVTLTQNLFNGLTDLAKVNQAKANEGLAHTSLLKIKAQVSYNLKVAFESLDYSQRSEKLSQEIIARRDQNLKLVQLQYKVGRENKGSVLLYQAYLQDAKYADLQSKDSVITSKALLAQALGLDDFDFFSISGEIPSSDPVQVDLKKIALETPGYLQAYYQEKSADESVTLARAGFFPTLGLTGILGKTGSEWFPQNNHWSIGVDLTIPLFSGGRDFYATQSALASRRAANHTLHESAHQVLSQLEQANMAYVEAIEKVKVDTSYLEAAKVRAEIARADYKNGIMSFQDWDLSETDLITREKSLLQSQQNRIIAEAAWEQTQGKGVIP